MYSTFKYQNQKNFQSLMGKQDLQFHINIMLRKTLLQNYRGCRIKFASRTEGGGGRPMRDLPAD
jgi:hypothetical protein